ncbi:hypothetical protein HY405_01275 [Candidatus Microgenomates bacterium]|nr:hypothetical protein [Candidatus Microgenomates bacterium]
MKKNFLLLLSAALIVFIGYMFINGRDMRGIRDVSILIPKPLLPKQRIVQLTLNEQNNSKQSGIARLKELNGNVVVSIVLENPPKDVLQPAHIHTGSCPNPGAIKYQLESVVDGNSETTINNMSLDRLASEIPLAINVHKSAAEASKYVACGNLPQSY